MSTACNTVKFYEVYDLGRCIQGCKLVDDARIKLNTDPLFSEPLSICNKTILNLCHAYCMNPVDHGEEGIGYIESAHPLMIASTFISADDCSKWPPASSEKFKFLWTCVGVVCFTLSLNFNAGDPKLSDLLPLSGIKNLKFEREFYKCAQMHVLAVIKWKLFFPTG